MDAFALKPFTKALTCLSKYGDELVIYATADTLSLSATNSSKSAYCRFKYEKQFFSRYSVGSSQSTAGAWADKSEEAVTVTGQLLTKVISVDNDLEEIYVDRISTYSLLSILRHRTVEKTVERCEISIVEGRQIEDMTISDEDQDGLESKLIVRLHCKHGIIKTHRLLLLTPTSLMAPGVPDAFNESCLTIGPKAVKDMIDHFPLSRGPKSDPQLIWSFSESEVELRSLESSTDSGGMAQLATELTISADEFDVYNIYTPPITIAFHLREFNATIAFADSMSLPLDLRFTDPAAPLFIDVEGNNSETLFVISTSQVHGAATGTASPHRHMPSHKKREREETPADYDHAKAKKPMKAVQLVERAELRSHSPSRISDALPANSAAGPSKLQSSRRGAPDDTMPPPSLVPSPPQPHVMSQEPLFLPDSSQLSVAQQEVLRSSGLGIEDMDADELADMLEGDGEEVAFDFSSQRSVDRGHCRPQEQSLGGEGEGPDSFELEVEDAELAPTQPSDRKMFQPLFED